jgi:hypothetical protein
MPKLHVDFVPGSPVVDDWNGFLVAQFGPKIKGKRPSNAPVMDGMAVMDSVYERRFWSVGCSSWPCGD